MSRTEDDCYTLDGGKRDLSKEPWDILIILDACRYDAFKEVYLKYLSTGDLKKAISPAIHTMDWLNRAFPSKYDDVIYFSTNPYVNSRIEVTRSGGKFKYDGKKHFKKVIDVWDSGWDQEVGSVFPDEVNKAFFSVRDEHPNARFVLHYMQPHAPYVGDKYINFIKRKKSKSTKPKKKKQKGALTPFKKITSRFIRKTFGVSMIWRISKLLHGEASGQSARIFTSEGWIGLRNAHVENLELVMHSVKEIIEKSSGTILITADHGQFLGEHRQYGHPNGIRKPENTEVPWMTITGKGAKVASKQKVNYDTKKSDEVVADEINDHLERFTLR